MCLLHTFPWAHDAGFGRNHRVDGAERAMGGPSADESWIRGKRYFVNIHMLWSSRKVGLTRCGFCPLLSCAVVWLGSSQYYFQREGQTSGRIYLLLFLLNILPIQSLKHACRKMFLKSHHRRNKKRHCEDLDLNFLILFLPLGLQIHFLSLVGTVWRKKSNFLLCAFMR